MAEYQCEACNYRIETQKRPRVCPYCGKSETVKPVMSAEQLMEDTKEKDK